MFIIGIAGGTGSGKTTIVRKLIQELHATHAVVLSQDNYYKDFPNLSYEERCELNFDHPDSIDFDLLDEHLETLRQGGSIWQPIYSFDEHARLEKTLKVSPSPLIIVEGILVLVPEKIRRHFDLKLFVYADADERLIRRIQRDTAERSRDLEEILNRYRDTLKPMHNLYIQPSMRHADLIIPNDAFNRSGVQIISEVLRNKIL